MIRKFKALGLAMVAVLAMSAVVASAAQAQFTTNANPTVVTTTSELGNDVFKVDGSSVECKGHFEGEAENATETSLTIKATYTDCKAFSFAHATVDMNGCDYVFYGAGAKKGEEKGDVDVKCEEGKGPIKIVASTCEVQVPAQKGLGKVALTNHHPHVDADAAVTGITANRTKDGFLCPLTGTGHVSNAEYNQAAAIHVEPKSGGTTISVD